MPASVIVDGMQRAATQSPQLAVLGKRLKDRLGNARLAQQAIAAVKDRAPDDQLALAFLTKLAENSPNPRKDLRPDETPGGDRIFSPGPPDPFPPKRPLAVPEWSENFSAPP